MNRNLSYIPNSISQPRTLTAFSLLSNAAIIVPIEKEEDKKVMKGGTQKREEGMRDRNKKYSTAVITTPYLCCRSFLLHSNLFQGHSFFFV
mmetsp:Transcript_9499/g.11032  ORF Transcript_9499/g.11032 Transcript_9499/m.11032 type:complete len:91 (-) Transcript_9499:68-340(-)